MTDIAELRRVFGLQQAHQWEVKSSSAAERKAKLTVPKAAVAARADAIVTAVLEDSHERAIYRHQ